MAKWQARSPADHCQRRREDGNDAAHQQDLRVFFTISVAPSVGLLQPALLPE
jgi:hypothetical protein